MNGSFQAVCIPKHFIRRTLYGSLSHFYTTIPTISSSNISTNSTKLRSILLDINSSNNPTKARQLFDELSERTCPFYNVMIRCYTRNQQPIQALQLFVDMLASEQYRPDNFTYPFVLKACGDSLMLKMGVSIHSRALVNGFRSDPYVQNSLISMYMNCGWTEDAQRIFDEMLEKTVVSWNSMISGYFSNGFATKAVMVFDQMMYENVAPDHATAVSVLPACASLKDLHRGRQVHELVMQRGVGYCKSVWNALVDMYAKCGCLFEAREVFDEMNERDVVSWTAMIGGYVTNGDARSAMGLCSLMQLEGITPNSVTVACLLSACVSSCDMKHGKCIHGWVMRHRLELDVVVETSLIDLYAKCNCMDLSVRMFNKTSKTRTVPWNALISGYVHNGLGGEAIQSFKQMQVEMVKPDAATLIGLLPAFADLADLQQAKNIHCYLIKSGFHPRIETYTSLIDIYSKCGSVDFAYELFKVIPEEEKDVYTWSAIISGYGMHGHGEFALILFYQMVQAGLQPNEVTFTSVLDACSHAGLVDDGLRLFKSIVMDHKLRPRTDHYTCIIDLVGRAGRLNEAYKLIKAMPIEPNHAVWGALLGACVIHQEVELGEVAAQQLFELEPYNTGNYVLLAKLYGASGRWEDAESVRSMISDRGLTKPPGCSSIEITNNVNVMDRACQSR